MNTFKKIIQSLSRPAVSLKSEPANDSHEKGVSWLGRVGFCLPGQEIPCDPDGEAMQPLAMIFLDRLECVPQALAGVKMVSIFWSQERLYDGESTDKSLFRFYEYDDLDALVPCDWDSDFLEPVSLIAAEVFDDFPDSDNQEIPDDVVENIVAEVKKLSEDDFDDLWDDPPETSFGHKVGGWPAFLQYGEKMPDGFRFVIQIASDPNALLEIGDDGAVYFFRNPSTKQWNFTWDCN